jgi:hypothetical protein
MTGAYMNLSDEVKGILDQNQFPTAMYHLKTRLMASKSIRSLSTDELMDLILFTMPSLYPEILNSIHKIETKILKP